MQPKSSPLQTTGLIVIAAAVLLSGGAFTWCSVVRGCTFGKYEGKVTLTHAETQAPLPKRHLSVFIDYDNNPLVSNKTPYYALTDDKGQAKIEFDRDFDSPLTIINTLQGRPIKNTFRVRPEDIKANTTVPQAKIERYATVESMEKDPVKLDLEVGDWSFGFRFSGIL